MKYLILFLLVLLQVSLVILLDCSLGNIPALGSFFSPQHGFWQNATPVSEDTPAEQISFPFTQLNKKVDVVFDQRGVPRIFAENWNDAAFAQGYIHAKDRLFQMDLMTRLAGGRLAEIVGEKALPLDRKNRMLGLSEAADNMAIEIFKDETTKSLCLAYVSGINFYLANLPKSNYPLEYKLLGVEPEVWDVKKVSLMYKYLSWDLSGSMRDIALSAVKKHITEDDYAELLYPIYHIFSNPTVSHSEQNFSAIPDVLPTIDSKEDKYFNFDRDQIDKSSSFKNILPNNENLFSYYNKGSNSWVVGTQKSSSGNTMLCNDPHLSFSLPSVWYEVQLTVNGKNAVYGFSVPGIPLVLIGFNSSIAWGLTSSSVDLTDYYYINWIDKHKKTYLYDKQVYEAEPKEELYKLKDGSVITDTIWTTSIGNIIPDEKGHEDITIQWVGKIPSNEIKGIWGMDTSTLVENFRYSLEHIFSPGVNVIYATQKDIGYRMTGAFPIKWERQGDFIMPLSSDYVWKKFIPSDQLPQTFNPAKHYIFNTNQHPTGEGYPYYLGFRFSAIRSNVLQQNLVKKEKLDVEDMKRIQNDNSNFFAQLAIQNLLIPFVDENTLTPQAKKYFQSLVNWNFVVNPHQSESTYFKIWWQQLKQQVYSILFGKGMSSVEMPQDISLLELMMDVPKFEDLINRYASTSMSIEQIVQSSFISASNSMQVATSEAKMENPAYFRHLLGLEPFSRSADAGGSKFSLNAIDSVQGPSMRFIVDMGNHPTAYTAYPGGQSGNPGDIHYDDGIRDWALGKYHQIKLAHTPAEVSAPSKRIQFVVNID